MASDGFPYPVDQPGNFSADQLPALQEKQMSDPRTEAFTLVFEGDIRKFRFNPLTTETPFGVAIAASVGSAIDAHDALVEALRAVRFSYAQTHLTTRQKDQIDAALALARSSAES